MRKLFGVSILLLFLLSACIVPKQWQPMQGVTAIPDTPSNPVTETLSQDYDSTECGFVWAREPLADLSGNFKKALKDIQPQANGYAEAYGENCIDNQGEVVRFLAMETDFHVTLRVKDLNDKQALGDLIEQVLGVVSKFPVEQTPGSQPGYVGITFEAPGDNMRLWFTQLEAQAAIEAGLGGEELFNILQAK